MVAVGFVGLLGLDLRTLIVVEAHPHGLGNGGVALDREGLGHEFIALVRVASELFQHVLAVRKRCQPVVNVGIGAVLAEGEPYARLGVHVGCLDALSIEQAVVAVGVAAVLVPGRGRRDVSVAVGHDDVGLAGGDVGHLERHLQGGVGVLGHLHDLKVVADHLVEELKLAASRGRLDDRAVLADLEGLGLAVGEQVGVVGLGLLDGVGAVRQLVGRGLGGVCAGLVVPGGNDGLDDVAGLEPLVAHEDLVLGFVGDGELDAGERGAGVEGVMGVAAQGLGVLQLDVGLGHLHAAADHVVAAGIAGEVDHLAVGLDLSLRGPVGNEISLGCLGLDHGVGAARKGIGGSLGDICACIIIPLAGDGLHHLPASVVSAVDEGVPTGFVDDVVLGAVEGCVALGLGACLGVFLRHLQATLVPCEAHEHLGAGARVDAEGLEAGRNLVLARLDGLPGGAQKLASRPVLEVAAGAEDGIGLGALVDIRQEHVACHGVLVRAPAAAVVPGVGEHGRVEARGAVAEPHRCDEVGVAYAALAVGAGRGCAGCRLGAVGNLAVGVHMGR